MTITVVVAGAANGPVVVLDEPLSFWGGFSAISGAVTDEHHAQAGTRLAGAIVVMESGRGSSSASSVLAESVRLGTAPAAILLRRNDDILVTGALAARELYGTTVPIVVLGESTYAEAIRSTSATLTDAGLLSFA